LNQSENVLSGVDKVTHDYSQEQRFWAWFQQREEKLFNFELDEDRIFAELDSALAKVSPHLTFEFSPIKNGTREFVISADGIKADFPAIEALTAAAPALPRWKIIKFRQRQSPIAWLTFAGKTVRPVDVEFCLLSNGRELGVYLFFDTYSENEADIWGHIAFLFPDQALGEYDVAAKVGPVKAFHSDAHPGAARYTLPELPERFDAHFSMLDRKH
jgi:hypothetical protein